MEQFNREAFRPKGHYQRKNDQWPDNSVFFDFFKKRLLNNQDEHLFPSSGIALSPKPEIILYHQSTTLNSQSVIYSFLYRLDHHKRTFAKAFLGRLSFFDGIKGTKKGLVEFEMPEPGVRQFI